MAVIKDEQRIHEMWSTMKSEGDKYKPVWDDIALFTGISVEPDYLWHNRGDKARTPDFFVDDPTSAISVNQSGDYLIGIMWGTGAEALDIVPSRYVLEFVDKAEVEDWYSFITDQTLYHVNHADAGFHTALKPYAYDQQSFGTSGIGVFPNSGFTSHIDDNALIFRNFGIDNTRLAEGKSGMPDTVFCQYHWKTNRIVGEFAMKGGEFDQKKFDKLPKAIREAWTKGQFNQEFDLVFGFFPRQDFDPKFKGKRGTRYRGVWFLDDTDDRGIFSEESYAEKPIGMVRQVKVRGEAYGRSSGTMLISSIRSVNFMVGTVIEILEKMANPSLGVFSNSLFGDSVLDTSPNGLTVFNSDAAASAGKGSPLFPIHDVGDPSGIVQFLIPYLNDKITTAFKVDLLLDFSSSKEMTATESLQRFVIRGKSLAGMLQQQKIEGLEIWMRRAISILMNIGEFGVNPNEDAARAKALTDIGKPERIIPEAVLQVMATGRPWYEIKWNNELEKLSRTQSVEALMQVLQTIIVIAGVFPDIIEAVDWYKLLRDINDNLDFNSQIILSEEEFKAKIEAVANQRQAAIALQAAESGAKTQKDVSQANKTNVEAQNGGR